QIALGRDFDWLPHSKENWSQMEAVGVCCSLLPLRSPCLILGSGLRFSLQRTWVASGRPRRVWRSVHSALRDGRRRMATYSEWLTVGFVFVVFFFFLGLFRLAFLLQKPHLR
ncbi:unnamed protein product, partial [Phaeothamnion confervicola]